MDQWEIHALRGLVSNVLTLVRLHSRAATVSGRVSTAVAQALDGTLREMYQSHQANQLRAVSDQEYRTRPTRGTEAWTT